MAVVLAKSPVDGDLEPEEATSYSDAGCPSEGIRTPIHLQNVQSKIYPV